MGRLFPSLGPPACCLGLSVCSFADATGSTLFGERVENRDDLGTLRILGVGHPQGYYLARRGVARQFGRKDGVISSAHVRSRPLSSSRCC